MEGIEWIVMTALLSGVSIFLNKFAVAGIDSSLFTFSKNLVSGIFLFSTVFLLGQHKDLAKLKTKDWLTLVLIGLVGGSIPFLLFFKGLQMIPAAQASLLQKTLFIWTAALAAIFLKEKLDKKYYAGAGLLLVGNFLMLNLSGFALSTGALLILAATLLWAVENTLSKSAVSTMSGSVVAAGRMLFGSAFILAYLISSGGAASVFSLTVPQLGWIAFTSVLLFAYAYTWYTGLETTPLSVASCILLLGSPVTTLLSVVFTGAQISLPEAAGMILIFFGTIVTAYSASARIFSSSSSVKQ